MTWVESITRHFIGTHSASGSVTHRQRRWNDLATRFPDLADMSVLDMGGTVESWRLCPTQPARLVLLNTFAQESEAEVIVGDACEPPAALQSQNFDLVFSNSVIEHVGGAWRRQRFAAAVRSLGAITGFRRHTGISQSSRTSSAQACSTCQRPSAHTS